MDLAHLVQAGALSARRLARSPSVHFLILGALLVAADAAWNRLAATDGGADRTIVLAAADVELLRRGFVQQYGRAPTAAEQRGLVDRAVDEEVLYRRAREIGLDRGNRVVRERLVAVMRMLGDDARKDDDALYREAVALRLDRTDLVVRRHLVQLMTLLLKRSGPAGPVGNADLDAVLQRDADRYRLAAQLTLTHVYLDPRRRGRSLDADAEGILGELRSGAIAPDAAPALGDPFLLGSRFTKRSETEIRRLLGEGFAVAAAAAPPGRWSGPVRSTYGLHLLLVEERIPGRTPSLEQVRNQLVGHLLEERGETALRAKLADLRRQYAVRIEESGQPPMATASVANDGIVLPVSSGARELGD